MRTVLSIFCPGGALPSCRAPYRTILDQIRLSFPQPVSDRIHDAYFVFSILRALDQIDAVLISMTECYRPTDYGTPIVALKAYSLSPFIDEEHIELLVAKGLEARERLGAPAGRRPNVT